MGHPTALLDLIEAELALSYPEPGTQFIRERPLRLKDRRMQPDLQVFSANGDLLCVVEIGYTRPEKLKAYRSTGIPDVRWYSKSGELVENEVTTKREIIYRDIEYRFNEADTWFAVSDPNIGTFECPPLLRAVTSIIQRLTISLKSERSDGKSFAR